MGIDIGRIGVWTSAGERTGSSLNEETVGSFAAEVEKLGYGALWIGGSQQLPLTLLRNALAATERLVVGTGIFRVWDADAAELAPVWRGLDTDFPGRFLLGLGVGHAPHVTEYVRPYQKMTSYLDELDEVGVPRRTRVLAALGPKMIKLAGDRGAGIHPYLTTPAHTKGAREILGAGPLVVPEQKVVVEPDLAKARQIARPTVRFYLDLPNYVNNFRREGFTDADFADGGSDRLIDALIGLGTAEQAFQRVRGHLDAGADQVAVQVLGTDLAGMTGPLAQLAEQFAN
ncbi:MAG TPA: LLM class F420-dependent oxidoreductase [Pseudonocardiaceae bacterium]|nr:LLM class F420-dependent oxidoreductase [Pseudonocardiaceae bacterium]